MTELEHKAEEYAVNSIGSHPLQEDLRECAKYSYIDGYEQGQKEVEELKWEQKQILEDNEFYQKENEKLKALADNRGAFIDWVLEHYPDVAKEYTGFTK